MIIQLVRTEFEGNQSLIGALVLTTVLAFFMLVVFLGLGGAGETLVFSILLSAVIGVFIHQRGRQEKRIRLYSQLPVSNLQVSLAGWCFKLLCLGVPGFVWLILGLLAAVSSQTHNGLNFYNHLIRDIVVFYCIAVCFLAVLSIGLKVTSRPSPVASYLEWLWLIIFIAIVFVFFVSFATGSLFNFEGEAANWSLLIPFLGCSATLLVIADISLHNLSDNYLG